MKRGAKKGKTHAGRGGNNISLHPLTPDQALSALLNVSPKDVKEIKEDQAAVQRGWRKPKSKKQNP